MKYIRTLMITSLLLFTCTLALAQEGKVYSNDWDKVKLKGLNLIRLEVPGGWLVREGLGKMAFMASSTHMMIFLPDPGHLWRDVEEKEWQNMKLKGLNLFRLPVPQGWLIREGWGKIGAESEIHMISFLSDPNHEWTVKKK